MAKIETYLENADELAQAVVNAWGSNVNAGNGEKLSPSFMSLFDKACNYRDAKEIAEAFRASSRETEQQIANETSKRREFAEAYKAFREEHEK